MAEIDLLEMPKDEFTKFISGLRSGQERAPRTNELPPSVAPETVKALSDANNALRINTQDYVSESGKRMGIRPGTFLNINEGVPATTRMQLGLDENQLNQFKILAGKYGATNVDLSDEGRFIIRNQPDGNGGTQDIMADPVGFDRGDVAQFGSQIGPMIAGAVAARYGGKVPGGPVAKILSATTAMALGQEAAGAGQDAFVRWLRNNEVNFSEIAKHRAALAVADEVFGLAAAGGSKVLGTAAEGLLGLGGLSTGSTATKKAAEALEKSTGVKFPLSPGQESESRLLLRLESMAGGRPGSASAMDKIATGQADAENELRRVFLGLPREMTDEELSRALPQADIVGQQGLRGLGKEAARLEGNVQSATEDILKTGTKEVQDLANVNLAQPIDSTAVGKSLRNRVVSSFNEFRSAMGERYEEFLSRPEIRARTISGDGVAAAAGRAETDFVPKAERIVDGKKVTEPLESFVPAKFRGFIEELKGLKGANVSVNDLKRIRTAIDNSISEGVAIPGTDVAQLNRLKDVVDNGITDALQGMDKLPAAYKDTSPLAIWQKLKSDYAAGSSKFDRVGIRDMLVREGETGSVGNTKIAERIVGDSPDAMDRYNDYKEFFGADSSEFKAIQTVAKQDALFGSLSELNGYVDGAALRARLRNLRPQIAEELFGADKNELHRIGEVLSRAQGKLDSEELAKLANSKSLTAEKISALEVAESERAIAYNNKLVKAAARGTLGAEKIKPSEFVRYATEMDPQDAAKVMGLLSDNPELVQDIRQLAVEQLWSKARAGALGQEKISATMLNDAMRGAGGKDTQIRTWRTILGNDTVDSLESLVKVLTTRDFAAAEYKGGSRLAGSSDLSNMFLKGSVGELKEVASRYLIGFLYSGPLKRSVTNLATSTDSSRFLNGVIASTPFIEGLMSRFGSDGAFLVMNALRDAVEPVQRKQLFMEGKIQEFDPSTLSKDEFATWLENAAPQDAAAARISAAKK